MSNVTLINVHVIGKIEGLEFTGGLSGFCDRVSMKNVDFDGQIYGKNNTGGLVGSITKSKFLDGVVTGKIVGSGNVRGDFGSSFDHCEIANISLPCTVEKSDEQQIEWPKSPVKDFKYLISGESVTITGYNGPGGKVIVPDSIEFKPVVYIGHKAFYGKQEISCIILPNSVLNIDHNAFQNCNNLNSFTLSSNIEYIGYRIFAGCSSLREIFIPKSLQRIAPYDHWDSEYPFVFSSIEKVEFEEGTTNIIENLFCRVNTLKEIIFPNSLTSIGPHSFDWCQSLKQVNLPNQLRNIESYAFSTTGIMTITLPNSVKEIGSFAFASSKLETIIFSKQIRTINNNLFDNCLQLESIIIPDNIINIEHESFKNCRNLYNITLSSNVEYIGYRIFAGCSNLREIFIPKSLQRIAPYDHWDSEYPFVFSSIEKVEFEEGTTNIIENLFCRVNTLKEIIFPNSLTSIGPHSFKGCSLLTKITIPLSVNNIDQNSFQNCLSLTFQVISGSYAEKYAKKNNIKFTYIDHQKTKLKQVTASIQPSSCVFNNTEIKLYSSIPNSIIYFKTNEIHNYQIYNEPIVIIKDTVISAYAKHENYLDSEIVTYSYVLCKSYKVSFDPNGGDVTTSSKNVTNNTKYGELPTPTRADHTFNGWYIDLSSNLMITSETILNISHDVTLHAKWTKNKIDASLGKKDDEARIEPLKHQKEEEVHVESLNHQNEKQIEKVESIENNEPNELFSEYLPFGEEFIKGLVTGGLLAFITAIIIFKIKNSKKKKHNSNQGQ